MFRVCECVCVKEAVMTGVPIVSRGVHVRWRLRVVWCVCVININAITMIVININAQIVINHSPPVESEHLGHGHAPQKYFQTRNTTPHDW